MYRNKLMMTAMVGLMLIAGACSKSEPAATEPAAAEPAAPAAAEPVAAAPAPVESADDVFKNRCSTCHGPTGGGDGPASAALNPKPRNFSDAAWQQTATDDGIKKAILYGGAAVGKSAVMPSHPDLEAKPAVLDGLIKIIRGAAGAH